MSQRILDDYLDDVRRRLGHLTPDERDAVIGEMRAHLVDKIDALLKADPALSRDDAALRATHAFGTPDEITVQYGPQGGIVKSSTGETLLRVAALGGRALRATGRGLGRTLKWTALVFAITISAALIAATVVVVVFDDEIRGLIPHTIYAKGEYYESRNGTLNESFDVPSVYHTFQLQIYTYGQDETSCVGVNLTSPDGDVIDLSVRSPTGGCYDLHRELTFAQPGRWHIRYDFDAYSGWIDVNVDGYR